VLYYPYLTKEEGKNKMHTPQNIVEFEAHMDEFEEQEKILRQMAEEELKVGSPVVLLDPVAQSVFGKGIHTVEGIFNDGEIVKIRLWHGKRSIKVTAGEIKKATAEDIAKATKF
jgi:hypothetical protein